MIERVVVITGATGKLGPTLAERFAGAGDRAASPAAGTISAQRIPLLGRS